MLKVTSIAIDTMQLNLRLADMLFTLFRTLLFTRRATNLIAAPSRRNRDSDNQDHSGRGVSSAVKISVIFDPDTDVIFPNYPGSLARALWRSQELTLLRRALNSGGQIVLDFGCGDGSFASALKGDHPNFSYGVDIDPIALKIADSYQIYDSLLTFEQLQHFEPKSVDFVFSCSVLEHTTDLPSCLSAIGRVLRPGGKFAFTVPSAALTQHMTTLVDPEFAESANEEMYHRNLYSAEQWRSLLNAAGFEVLDQLSFQPINLTKQFFALTVLNAKQLGRIPFVSAAAFHFMKRKLLKMVSESIGHHHPDGANHFFIARIPLHPEA